MRPGCRVWGSMLLSLLPVPARAQERTVVPAVGVTITASDDTTREVRIGGDLFTILRTADQPSAPLCFPILGPLGVPMMRRFPFETVAGEPQDHPHHRSLWFSHGDVNGLDFWTAKRGGPSIRCDGFAPIDGAEATDTLELHDTWVDPLGVIVCTDRRRLQFLCAPDDSWRAIDHRITLFASSGALRFGDTKEGTFAFRMAPGLALSGEGARGRLVDSEGRAGNEVWGKRARWIAYDGEVDGHQVGFVMMDHPDNPRHPTFWHARDYGLAAANPFGEHDFTGAKGEPGALVLAAGADISFRHRIVFFRGAVDREAIERRFEDFAHATAPAPAATGKQQETP